jgi:tripartite-type tricarboxylate transporter receptor subunit TctC
VGTLQRRKSSATLEANMSPKRSLRFAGLFFGSMALGCAVWPLATAAQQPYPNRLIKFIHPYVAGGPSDIVTRAIAEKMSISLKQPIVIENRPGEGGNIGTEAIARAAPDGYTLGMVLGTTLTVNPSLYNKLPFDPDRDFRPISIVSTSGNMLVVHPSVPINSVAEFVAYAKAAAARKEPVAYASGGIGTPGHLVMENFRVRAGFEAIHVPYRGNAPMVIDLVAGQVKFGFVTSAGMMDHVQAGRLKALGVARANRSPLAPEVPTIAESGYPGFRVENYSVMLAPTGIAKPIVMLLEREVQAALKHPDIIERLRAMDTTPVVIIGPEVQARLKADREAWAKVVAAANMRLD